MNVINIILLVIFALLQCFDYYLTTVILKNIKGAYELNPVMSFLLSKFGDKGMAVSKFLSVLIVIVSFVIIMSKAYSTYLMIIADAVYIWVVIHNYMILYKKGEGK